MCKVVSVLLPSCTSIWDYNNTAQHPCEIDKINGATIYFMFQSRIAIQEIDNRLNDAKYDALYCN